MSLLSKLKSAGQKTVDQAVGVTSGAVPSRTLDSPRVFQLIATLIVVALGISSWLVWHTIASATKIKHLAVNTTNQRTAIGELKKLQNKDTDGDGLSDYDELFSLHTSPYLKDSDSDGVSDKDEITKGTDPNCPKGSTCTTISAATAPTDQNAALTPQFLRSALLASGVPQTTIDQLNDADLLSVYQKATAEAGTNVNGPATAPTLDTLNNLTPAQIRKLLIDSGLEAASLEKVDDATLKQIYQQAISQQSSTNTNQ